MALTAYQTVKSFVQAMMNWTLKGGKFVDPDIANARAAICAGCHNNSPTAEIKGGCSSCRRGGAKIVEMLFGTFLGSRKTASDAKLKVCGLCGCPLKVKVWMPIAALDYKPQDANAFPTFCWVKAVVENKEI